MKKRDLWTGIVMVLFAALCLLIALVYETPMSSVLCGFTGGVGVPGAIQIGRYVKWSKPENAAEYQERLEQQRIELRDERKEMLRNKAGRYAYLFSLLANAVIIFILALLDTLGVIPESRWLILSLGVWLLAQYFAGILIYRWLCGKY